eukprot:1789560-Amphidinium_carterae.1
MRKSEATQEEASNTSPDTAKFKVKERTSEQHLHMIRSTAQLLEALLQVLWIGPVLWTRVKGFHQGTFWQAVTWQTLLQLCQPFSNYLDLRHHLRGNNFKAVSVLYFTTSLFTIVCTAGVVKWGGLSACQGVWAIQQARTWLFPWAQFVPMMFGFSPW